MSEYADVHKCARILEGEIDLKLTHLNKMCLNPRHQTFKLSATLPSEHTIEMAGSEIQDLLGKLHHLHDQMSVMAVDDLPIPTKHTLQRHGEILQDYKKELQKILDNYRAAKEREELLVGRQVKMDGTQRQPGLEAEHLMISNANVLVDHQLHLAFETKVQLHGQRKSIKKLQTRLRDLYHRFPVMDDLIRKAGRTQYRKSICLGLLLLVILGLTLVPSLITNNK